MVEGLKYLLDTNVLSEPMRRKPDAELVERLDRHPDELATASTVWHEMIFGLERLSPSRRRDTLHRYLEDLRKSSMPVLPYDEAASEWHARERARLEKAGRPVPFRDSQIASVARIHDLILVTGNASDFEPFAGLRIENWMTPTEISSDE